MFGVSRIRAGEGGLPARGSSAGKERGDDQALRIDAKVLFGRGVGGACGRLVVAFRLMDLCKCVCLCWGLCLLVSGVCLLVFGVCLLVLAAPNTSKRNANTTEHRSVFACGCRVFGCVRSVFGCV